VKKKNRANPFLLLLAAVIWGTAFVAQKETVLGSFTYNGIRSLVGGIVLLPAIAFLDKLRAKDSSFSKGTKKNIYLGGIACGVVLFIASNLQQYGIALQDDSTNVGKAGFITACYCAFVPVLSVVFLKKRQPKMVWVGAVVAVVGFFFLCLMDGITAGQGFSLGPSDLLLLLCSVMFAVHILVCDHFTAVADGVRLSCIQFITCGVLSCIAMFIVDKPTVSAILGDWFVILYAGILSCGVAYTLQIVGQKGVNPSIASLILSLESVFSVLSGWVFEGGKLTGWELLGCILVFGAVLLVNLAPQKEALKNG
jgi:drug/metabolite transporter (DMT)-like permease